MLLLIEGLAMCFIMLITLVVGIAFDGPVGLVTFYEDDVKKRVVERGLITKKKIKRNGMIAGIFVFLPIIIFIPCMVYGINGASGFKEGFIQMVIIGMIYNLFDRIFVDWIWVSKTNAWNIPGTEDLKPYVPMKTAIRKWIATMIGFPALFALIAWIMTFLMP